MLENMSSLLSLECVNPIFSSSGIPSPPSLFLEKNASFFIDYVVDSLKEQALSALVVVFFRSKLLHSIDVVGVVDGQDLAKK